MAACVVGALATQQATAVCTPERVAFSGAPLRPPATTAGPIDAAQLPPASQRRVFWSQPIAAERILDARSDSASLSGVRGQSPDECVLRRVRALAGRSRACDDVSVCDGGEPPAPIFPVFVPAAHALLFRPG